MAQFQIGQIVELGASGFLPDSTLQIGDRGTITSAARMNEFTEEEVKVLWRQNSRESWMTTRRLSLYTYPMIRPVGRAHGAGDTVRALAKVIEVELPYALEDVTRDLERARMEKEDLHMKYFSPYGNNVHRKDPRHRFITWREFGIERDEKCNELVEQIDRACDILHEAKRDALVADACEAHRQALKLARNSMIDALHELESDYSSGEDVSTDNEDQT